MSAATPAVPASPAVVDGVDVDAVAAAVRGCPAVEDLHAGRPDHTATYLPGRRVEGVRIERQVVAVQVRARWGVDVFALAAQVRAALTPLLAGRRIDVIVADLGAPVTSSASTGARGAIAWTTPPAADARGGARSSASITPTRAATPPPSSPA